MTRPLVIEMKPVVISIEKFKLFDLFINICQIIKKFVQNRFVNYIKPHQKQTSTNTNTFDLNVNYFYRHFFSYTKSKLDLISFGFITPVKNIVNFVLI